MALEKAKVIIEEGTKKGEQIDVLFNPTEYAIESGNQYSWQSVPGLSQPLAQFVSGEASSLSMDLFFDTYTADEDVRIYTMGIVELLDIDRKLHAPPLCTFIWGSLSFKGILEKVSQRYTMFNRAGQPVRATLNVSFKAVKTMQEQLQHTSGNSANRTKQRKVLEGETLWQIAADEYGDPSKWREIAMANDLDPRQLEPDTLIRIPRLKG